MFRLHPDLRGHVRTPLAAAQDGLRAERPPRHGGLNRNELQVRPVDAGGAEAENTKDDAGGEHHGERSEEVGEVATEEHSVTDLDREQHH